MGANCPSFSCCCILRHIFFVYGTNCPDFNMITSQQGKCRLGVNKIIELGFSTVSFLIWAPSEQQSCYLSQLYLLYTGVTPKIASFHIWAEKVGVFLWCSTLAVFPPLCLVVASQSVFLGGWQEIPHLTQTCSFDTFNLEDRQLIWNFFKGKKPMPLDFLASILSIVSLIIYLIWLKWSNLGYL